MVSDSVQVTRIFLSVVLKMVIDWGEFNPNALLVLSLLVIVCREDNEKVRFLVDIFERETAGRKTIEDTLLNTLLDEND